ncbi:MAG: ABC transporter ATP-binding protein [Candidatus Glassbacteria bacterium]
MKRVSRIVSFLKPYRRRIILLIVMMLVSTALGLAYPLFIKVLIDRVYVSGQSPGILILVVAIMFLVAIFRTSLSAFGSYLNTWITVRILFDMRFSLFQKLQRLPLLIYRKTRIGDLMARLNGDIAEVQSVAMGTLLGAVGSFLTLVGSVAILVWLNPKLFLISGILIPVSFLILRHYRERIRDLAREIREKNAELGHFLVESLDAAKFIRSHDLEKYEGRKFIRKNKSFILSILNFQVASSLADGLNGVFLALSSLIVLGYGGYLVMAGMMTLGSLIAFEVYQVRLFGPIQSLLGIYFQLQRARASVDRVFEYLDHPEASRFGNGKIALGQVRGKIELVDVTFGYRNGEDILRDLSFLIPEGKRYAIVGPSGSGKTTIIDLILGFYKPASGRILVDDTDIAEISARSLIRQVSVLTQEPVLFHATVAENIAYGRRKASREEIQEAAEKAGIDELIKSFPSGYDTVIGDRGMKLSSGERQRVAIARAFLREPNLLILDEATSSLDWMTDRDVQDALRGLMLGRTTIIITHRLSMVDDVDRILTLKEGRIVEEGTHTELMDRRGVYYSYFTGGFPGGVASSATGRTDAEP